MKRHFSSFNLVLAAAAFLAVIAGKQTAAAGQDLPSHVSETLKYLLNAAHTMWRPDAVFYQVELKQYAGQSWLQVGEYSPSTGDTLTLQVGGPNNGTFGLGHVDPANRFRLPAAIPPDFKIDLPNAVATLHRAGLKDPLGVTRLEMTGATGTPPLLLWAINMANGPMMYPTFVNAQDGMIIPWKRAMDLPNGSDAQLRAAWAALQRSRQPQPAVDPYAPTPEGCVAMIQAGFASC